MRPWTFWLLIGTASAAILALACVLGRQLWCRRRSEHGTLAGIAWQFVEREESERERLAKEIQNGFGHRLVLLRNAALTALAEPGSPKGVHQALDHISRLALSALEEARQMAHRLQPAEVDRVGFAKAVEDLLARLLVPRGVSVFQDLDGLEASFAKPESVYLYRLLDEMLRELAERPGLATVCLEIGIQPKQLRIRLQHDGRPASAGARTVAACDLAGARMTGVNEAIRRVGGEFRSSSKAGRVEFWEILIPRNAG